MLHGIFTDIYPQNDPVMVNTCKYSIDGAGIVFIPWGHQNLWDPPLVTPAFANHGKTTYESIREWSESNHIEYPTRWLLLVKLVYVLVNYKFYRVDVFF